MRVRFQESFQIWHKDLDGYNRSDRVAFRISKVEIKLGGWVRPSDVQLQGWLRSEKIGLPYAICDSRAGRNLVATQRFAGPFSLSKIRECRACMPRNV